MKNIHIQCLATIVAALLLMPLTATADGHDKSQKEVESMIRQAETSLEGARNVGHEWIATAGLIKAAKKALKDNDLKKSYSLATKADAQGKASIQQRATSDKYWTLNLPR